MINKPLRSEKDPKQMIGFCSHTHLKLFFKCSQMSETTNNSLITIMLVMSLTAVTEYETNQCNRSFDLAI